MDFLHRVLRNAALGLVGAAALWAQGGVEDLRITTGKSIVIDYPADISRISTSNPEVVDAVAVTTREILLNGKGQGAATLVVWGKNGQRTFYNISVEQNVDSLRRLLRDTFPNEPIQVVVGRDSLSLTGRVTSQSVADRAVAISTPFAKSVVNSLVVPVAPAEKQILLRVRFAELDRNSAKQFGVNLVSTGALGGTIGRTTTGQFAAPTPTTISTGTGTSTNFTLTDALNIFAFRPDLNLGAFIRALQAENILQILAEPNLVTTNGKEASFLVGGEFPIPVLQGGANAGAVTIQFREFGIRLTFNPTITANDTIRMYVKPEVSTLDTANGVTVSGFLVPALATRRVESTVELGAGQSFVIAGLMDDRVQDSMSRIPGLSNIPILGTLFKTRIESKQKSELVILVTPEITNPLNPADPKPLPAFPREFLVPVTPVRPGSTMMPGTTGSSTTKSSKGGKPVSSVDTTKDSKKRS